MNLWENAINDANAQAMEFLEGGNNLANVAGGSSSGVLGGGGGVGVIPNPTTSTNAQPTATGTIGNSGMNMAPGGGGADGDLYEALREAGAREAVAVGVGEEEGEEEEEEEGTVPVLPELSSLSLPLNVQVRCFSSAENEIDRIGEETDFVVHKKRRIEADDTSSSFPFVSEFLLMPSTEEQKALEQFKLLQKLPGMNTTAIREVFSAIRKVGTSPSLASYHKLLLKLGAEGKPEKVLPVLEEMALDGVSARPRTYELIVKALCDKGFPLQAALALLDQPTFSPHINRDLLRPLQEHVFVLLLDALWNHESSDDDAETVYSIQVLIELEKRGHLVYPLHFGSSTHAAGRTQHAAYSHPTNTQTSGPTNVGGGNPSAVCLFPSAPPMTRSNAPAGGGPTTSPHPRTASSTTANTNNTNTNSTPNSSTFKLSLTDRLRYGQCVARARCVKSAFLLLKAICSVTSTAPSGSQNSNNNNNSSGGSPSSSSAAAIRSPQQLIGGEPQSSIPATTTTAASALTHLETKQLEIFVNSFLTLCGELVVPDEGEQKNIDSFEQQQRNTGSRRRTNRHANPLDEEYSKHLLLASSSSSGPISIKKSSQEKSKIDSLSPNNDPSLLEGKNIPPIPEETKVIIESMLTAMNEHALQHRPPLKIHSEAYTAVLQVCARFNLQRQGFAYFHEMLRQGVRSLDSAYCCAKLALRFPQKFFSFFDQKASHFFVEYFSRNGAFDSQPTSHEKLQAWSSILMDLCVLECNLPKAIDLISLLLHFHTHHVLHRPSSTSTNQNPQQQQHRGAYQQQGSTTTGILSLSNASSYFGEDQYQQQQQQQHSQKPYTSLFGTSMSPHRGGGDNNNSGAWFREKGNGGSPNANPADFPTTQTMMSMNAKETPSTPILLIPATYKLVQLCSQPNVGEKCKILHRFILPSRSSTTEVQFELQYYHHVVLEICRKARGMNASLLRGLLTEAAAAAAPSAAPLLSALTSSSGGAGGNSYLFTPAGINEIVEKYTSSVIFLALETQSRMPTPPTFSATPSPPSAESSGGNNVMITGASVAVLSPSSLSSPPPPAQKDSTSSIAAPVVGPPRFIPSLSRKPVVDMLTRGGNKDCYVAVIDAEAIRVLKNEPRQETLSRLLAGYDRKPSGAMLCLGLDALIQELMNDCITSGQYCPATTTSSGKKHLGEKGSNEDSNFLKESGGPQQRRTEDNDATTTTTSPFHVFSVVAKWEKMYSSWFTILPFSCIVETGFATIYPTAATPTSAGIAKLEVESSTSSHTFTPSPPYQYFRQLLLSPPSAPGASMSTKREEEKLGEKDQMLSAQNETERATTGDDKDGGGSGKEGTVTSFDDQLNERFTCCWPATWVKQLKHCHQRVMLLSENQEVLQLASQDASLKPGVRLSDLLKKLMGEKF